MWSKKWKLRLFLLILVFVGLFLGKQQTYYRSNGKIDNVSFLLQNVVYVPTQIIKNIFDQLTDFINNNFNKENLSLENLNLKKSLTLLNYNEIQVKTLRKENDQLRELINLSSKFSNRTYAIAEVIAYFPYENRITLSKGSKDGIRYGLPIINHEGFVGIIDTVENSISQALLITSPALKVGGCIERDVPVLGIVKGIHSQALCLEILEKHASLVLNEPVYTTGLSLKIPSHLLLGRIKEIEEIPEYGTRKVILKPALNILDLKEVIIIL